MENEPMARRGRPPKVAFAPVNDTIEDDIAPLNAPHPSVPRAASAKRSLSVIYRPGEMDRPSVKWNGVTFKANIAVELDPDNEEHYITQLMPKVFVGPHGEAQTKHRNCDVFMGDLARNNPSFEVDGKRARKKINTRTVPPPGAEWEERHEGIISYSDQLDSGATA